MRSCLLRLLDCGLMMPVVASVGSAPSSFSLNLWMWRMSSCVHTCSERQLAPPGASDVLAIVSTFRQLQVLAQAAKLLSLIVLMWRTLAADARPDRSPWAPGCGLGPDVGVKAFHQVPDSASGNGFASPAKRRIGPKCLTLLQLQVLTQTDSTLVVRA